MPGQGKGREKDKGKRRQQLPPKHAENAPLDVLTFLKEQIQALEQPLKLLRRDEYIFEDQEGTEVKPPAQKTLDKAVKALNSQLAEKRKKRLNEASLQAVVEQVDYLKEEHLEGLHALQVDNDEGTVRVDVDDWLDEIPDEWPTPNARSQQLEQQELSEYKKLLEEVKALQAKECYLSQKDEHYERLERILSEGVDADRLARLLQGKAPAGGGNGGSKKRTGEGDASA